MRYALLLVLVVMILTALAVPGAQAGKPKPYPEPGGIEALSYPAPDPTFPLPGNPPPDAPYVWGAYNLDGSWRWYISKFTPAPVTDADIFLCTAQEDPYYQTCYRHRHDPPVYWSSMQYYSYEDGMSVYRSIPIQPCGWWGAYPEGSNWEGQSFVLHQPNQYLVPCAVFDNPIFLPFVRKPY